MKSSRIVDCHETLELKVDALSASISASLFHVAMDHCPGFDMYVNLAEPDMITQSIIHQTFALSSNFFLLEDLISPGGRVLDLGAHIGTFSLYAASAGYRLLSVEASPCNVALLKQGVLRNQFDSITIVEMAVSDSAGTAEFIVAGPYSSLRATHLADRPRVMVSTTTVDDIVRAEGWDHVDFIKMDVEGSEVAAVRGMAELLSGDHAPAILYESNGLMLQMFGETPARLMAALEAFGYHFYMVDGKALIPYRSGELQMDVIVDYLAIKRPLETLSNWYVREPLSVQEKIDRSLRACVHSHPHIRAHVARALADAGAEILADQRLLSALETLKYDTEADVREAVSWMRISVKPFLDQLQSLRQVVVGKDAEIARLQEQLAAYERGRFIRMMRTLSDFWRRLSI